MPSLKLTKSAVASARPGTTDYELRDTIVPGFFCKIMRRARHVEDTGRVPFLDIEAAARYLALNPHSLGCYRSLGGGSPFYKFGKFVRYAVPDLQVWAADRRYGRSADKNTRV